MNEDEIKEVWFSDDTKEFLDEVAPRLVSNEQIDQLTNEWMGLMDDSIDDWMNEWMDRQWMDGWLDGWMDGWMDGWLDGWLD